MTPAGGDFDRLAFDAVTVDYGRTRVLSRIAFTCTAGTITGLFGPNGAGKTTLLRLAAGRARASHGRVVYGDLGAGPVPAFVRARIGWLGHDPALYPELSAAENLRFFAALAGIADPRARVDEALRRAGLESRAADPVGTFSRGMRQRIGLERALLPDPRLVLLDEPFTGLDEASAVALVARLAALRAAGTIVLLSTHDPARVEPVLDAAVVLRGGRLAARLHGQPGLARAIADPGDEGDAPPRDDAPREPAAAAPPAGGGPAPRAGLDGPGAGATLAAFFRAAALVARKDVLVELRSRELAVTTLFFAVVAVLVFAFAFVHDGESPVDAPAGILWVTILFAGTLALARAFDREQASQTLPALLSAPVDRSAIYVGKLIGLVLLLAAVLAVVVPLVALLFQAPFLRTIAPMAGLLAAGTAGFVAVGGLFAAMLVRTRSRDVLLPVLLYPMVVPVMLAGVRGTAALLLPVPDHAVATFWLQVLVSYDAVFVTLALWVFDAVTGED
jgi:heme ABC exporter ATP-binding subunit CcmA/heme exporter protein CcmB